jgi:hypothetical protein
MRFAVRFAFARTLHLAQRAPQRFDFALVGVLLPFRKLKNLQDLLHLIEGLPKRPNDVVNLVNRFLNRLRRSRLALPVCGRSRARLSWLPVCRRRRRTSRRLRVWLSKFGPLSLSFSMKLSFRNLSFSRCL